MGLHHPAAQLDPLPAVLAASVACAKPCIPAGSCAATATTTRTTRPSCRSLIVLREERYRMLGYKTPADFYLEPRMAKTPAAVNEFLMRLWKPALEQAKAEATEMQKLIDERTGRLQAAVLGLVVLCREAAQSQVRPGRFGAAPLFQAGKCPEGHLHPGRKALWPEIRRTQGYPRLPSRSPGVRGPGGQRHPAGDPVHGLLSRAIKSRAAPGPVASAAPSTRTASASSRFPRWSATSPSRRPGRRRC